VSALALYAFAFYIRKRQKSNANRGINHSSDTLVLGAADVVELLKMDECVEAVAQSLKALSSGSAAMPLRMGFVLPMKDRFGVLASMPSFMCYEDGVKYCANKIITVFPSNAGTGMHSHQGAIMLFEAEHGQMKALVDASEVTAIRTAAASAVATRALASAEANILAILGSGSQADTHLDAMLIVRPSIKELRIWSRTHTRASSFAQRALVKYPNLAVSVSQSPKEAVANAHIICTLTGCRASEPSVLRGDWVARGAHINAVGACQPMFRELDAGLVVKSKLYADSRESCTKEPGDIVIPMKEGLINESHVVGELGELLQGLCPGRARASSGAGTGSGAGAGAGAGTLHEPIADDAITLFKSLGVAVEDLVSAVLVYKAALAHNKMPANKCSQKGTYVAINGQT
jgi:ornithine cyclodeaminase